MASIQTKLQIAIVLGTLVPFSIGFVQSRRAIAAGESVLGRQLDTLLAARAADVVDRWTFRRSAILLVATDESMARRAEIHSADSIAASAETATLSAQLPGVDEIRIYNTSGHQVWRASPGGHSLAWREVPQPFDAGTITFTAVLKSVTGAVVGDLKADVRVSSIFDPESPYGSGRAILVIRNRMTGEITPRRAVFARWRGDMHMERGDTTWLVRARTLDEPRLELLAAAPTNDFVEPIRKTALENGLALAAGTALAMIAAATLVRRVTGALRRVTKGAETVSRGNLAMRLDETGTDDIADVARAFNRMAASLNGTLDRLARREALAVTGEFAARLAHEVRNPLTSMRIDVQRLQLRPGADADGTATRLLHQVDRLDRYVTLTLGSVRRERHQHVLIDLVVPLTAAAHAAQPHFVSRDATLTIDIDAAALWAYADAEAIEQATLNLLMNAAQAVSAGGHAWLRAARSNGRTIIQVEDNGCGISPEVQAKAFDPFYTTKIDGSGLGLAIAQQIAEEHGGTIALGNREPGGAVVTFELPFPPAVSNTQTTLASR